MSSTWPCFRQEGALGVLVSPVPTPALCGRGWRSCRLLWWLPALVRVLRSICWLCTARDTPRVWLCREAPRPDPSAGPYEPQQGSREAPLSLVSSSFWARKDMGIQALLGVSGAQLHGHSNFKCFEDIGLMTWHVAVNYCVFQGHV